MLVKKEIIISDDNQNLRIDLFLSKHYKHISRNQWQERIKKGNVLVNGKKIRNSYLLKNKDIVSFYYKAKSEPNVNKDFKILYEDEDLLIIDKPANLPVHPSGNYKKNTLTQLLKENYHYFYCNPIHRLDRETSGLIIFGKNPEIIHKMAKLFLENKINKIYHTIVFGIFNQNLILEGYLGKNLYSKVLKRQMFIENNKLNQFLSLYKNNYQKNCDNFSLWIENQTYTYRYAKTEFLPEKTFMIEHPLYREITLLKVQLFTGRTHQIRATLKDSGYPIVGDKIYGIDENLFIKFLNDELSQYDYNILLLNRCALHCSELSFIHPKTNQKIHIKSPLPEDFQMLLKYTNIPA